MEGRKRVNTRALVKEAAESEHKESYSVLERGGHYRLGVGARLDPSGKPSFFLEVLVPLCESSSIALLRDLEMRVAFLKELEARGYSLSCEDGSCISCEAILPPARLASERRAIYSIAKRARLDDRR